MGKIPTRSVRRTDALSRPRIVAQAIAILDDGGIDALTFRSLAASLSTGQGALFHHVANKAELLALAATDVLAHALSGTASTARSAARVHETMTAAFDAMTAHPWLGAQLAGAPWQPAVLHLFDRIGSELDALDVPDEHLFDAASVLVHHVLGIASQFRATGELTSTSSDRPAFIHAATDTATDGAPHPFLEKIGPQLVHHDDRDQFTAGVDIIIAGITARARLDPHALSAEPTR
ncbi:TetR family transcriptional regulator [Williamsia deligens]|nr:transcriptional regulator, TetR family [Williamsia deligens]